MSTGNVATNKYYTRLKSFLNKIFEPFLTVTHTWCVQKVSRNLNFRELRMFDFRFFCGVMLVPISLTCADNFGHVECSVNF